MYSEVHGTIGWCIAELSDGDKKLRKWIFLAAFLPDLDAISFFWGQDAYVTYHHAISHGLLFSLICSSWAIFSCKKTPWFKVFFWTQLSFYSHYFGDYFFTQFPLYYFWPFSEVGFLSTKAVPLWHPINKVFQWISVFCLIFFAIKNKRTPIELISEKWDKKVVSSFSSLAKTFSRKNSKE
ncbi:MAG: metal-dependent hydrolase [Flavobacteriaceae bacterium]|nr:metal-dependent hydrolase [Flavobacteriaceae bacterium]